MCGWNTSFLERFNFLLFIQVVFFHLFCLVLYIYDSGINDSRSFIVREKKKPGRKARLNSPIAQLVRALH